MTDRRLIEAGFPCHQVGGETRRERDSGLAPPTHRLHVWWARRPLTASRAAIAGSLLPADTDINSFMKELGIEKKVVEFEGTQWVLNNKLAERVEKTTSSEELLVDPVVLRAFDKETLRRAKNRDTIKQLKEYSTELATHPVVIKWEEDSRPLSQIHSGERLLVKRVMGDPAHTNERLEFKKAELVKAALGKELSWDAEDIYGYDRAYQNDHVPSSSEFTVLDPTSGGGSIPFEAMRLGHNVVANELNPVAATILHATLQTPRLFGVELIKHIENYGLELINHVHDVMEPFYPSSPLPETEKKSLEKHLENYPELVHEFNSESVIDYLFCRVATCPSCNARTPLLNSQWISKPKPKEGTRWGVQIIANDKNYDFKPFQITSSERKDGKTISYGGNGECIVDDSKGTLTKTVTKGVGQCIHCKQAIEASNIKEQARELSDEGGLEDQIYCVVSVREQPKLSKNGEIQYFSTGKNKGKLKTEKVRFYRAPNDSDNSAFANSKNLLLEQWDFFDEKGLIPTEKFPTGNDMRPMNYGMDQWFKLFNPRQLLCHLTAMAKLSEIKEDLLVKLAPSLARAIVTYLQFVVDKSFDYNSRQTRWIPQRAQVSGTFGRHDFSYKWTYGEMVAGGEGSGIGWALGQVIDAYKGICALVSNVSKDDSEQSVEIVNGTAAHIEPLQDKSVDLICMDPPYYDNVQYAELSDFYYVWMKRTLKDLYPEISWPRLSNKREEAVANPARDGSKENAKQAYMDFMNEIFAECRRVGKDNSLLTIMFTHKSQDAWETLTRSLIEAGWEITSSFPVDSEFGNSMHQKDLAAAASSIFITCRKRQEEQAQAAFWSGLGGSGVQHQIRSAVEAGLDEFRPLKLNAVDQMIACYGRALQVLSENWPVMDGDEEVSPIRAMNEASRVVAEHQIKVITDGNISVDDLDTETAMALTMYGIWGHNEASFTEVLNLSRSLNISLETRTGGYGIEGRMVGINTEISGRTAVAGQAAEDKGYAAPLVKKGSKLRLAKPQERSARRVAKPQSDWDVLHGLLLKFREGDVPVARAYLDEQREGNDNIILDLLEVWGEEAETPEARNEARALLFGLRQQ